MPSSKFRIITSNFDAEFGRYPGAVVNTITRTGTDHFHGVAYDYLRNRILNAKDYFTAPGISPQFIYNIFGARNASGLLALMRFASTVPSV